jgi:hypothetical protein
MHCSEHGNRLGRGGLCGGRARMNRMEDIEEDMPCLRNFFLFFSAVRNCLYKAPALVPAGHVYQTIQYASYLGSRTVMICQAINAPCGRSAIRRILPSHAILSRSRSAYAQKQQKEEIHSSRAFRDRHLWRRLSLSTSSYSSCEDGLSKNGYRMEIFGPWYKIGKKKSESKKRFRAHV